MGKATKQKFSQAGSYVIRAGETRPTKVVGRVSGKTTTPTTNDKRAARAFVRLKKA
jgi:hypothetical protein